MTLTRALAIVSFLATVVIGAVAPAAAQPPAPAEAGTRSVTLALTEYDRLMDLADRAAPERAPAAAGSAAAIEARVEGNAARGTVTVTGTAVRPGASKVPLVAATTILDVPDGATVPALVTSGDVIAGIVAAPGPFAFTLAWRADVRTDAGRTTLMLPAARTGTARAVVEVPGEPGDLRVGGGTVTARRRTPAGATAIEITLVPATAAAVSWLGRDTAPVALTGPARVVSDVATVVTLTDTDVRVSALVTLEVSRGQLPSCTLSVPPGYRVAAVHGTTVDRVETTGEAVRISLLTPQAARHVLLAELERPWPGDAAVDAVTIGVVEAQRERGDLAVESPGTAIVTASTASRADRVDVREMGAGVRALARWPLLAAYRYQRAGGGAGPRVALDVSRFADAEVAPAIVSAAAATTLVTSDGRALTELRLQLANERQPFVKVGLPAGARIVSVDLDDEPAKPVSGADGVRLPLLHAERGVPARELRYVYLHDGLPFARKGEVRMALPAMDLPIGVVDWDVFVPDDIRARRVAGTALDAARFDDRRRPAPWMPSGLAGTAHDADRPRVRISAVQGGVAGQIRGRATDTRGGIIPGVTVTLRNGPFMAEVVTDARGEYAVSSVPVGRVSIDAALVGFSAGRVAFDFDGQPVAVDVVLAVGSLMEAVTVTGAAPLVDTSQTTATPDHVLELQQRVAGVLPIRIDVPRAGRSLRFVAPLVVEGAPSVTLRYRRR